MSSINVKALPVASPPRAADVAWRLTHVARIAAIAFLLVQVAGVLLRPTLPVDETRYLAVAWEMHLSHDWLLPSKNFALYTHKPPLLFWLINLSWAIFGVSEIAARLVAPLIAFVAILLTGKLATRLWPEEAEIGARAMLALIAMPFFLLAGGLTMFDALLTVGVLGGLIALTNAGEGRRSGWFWFGVSVAFGILAKGPVVLFHLVPAALTLPLWHRSRPSCANIAIGLGQSLATTLLLVALWLLPAIVKGGEAYRDAILWTQSAGRMVESFAHARPLWWYLPLLPLLFYPWALVPQLWSNLRLATADPAFRLLAIWCLPALLLFSVISGKQPHYLLPELPAVALLAARFLPHGRASLLPASVIPLLFLLFLLAGGAGLIPLDLADPILLPRSVPISGALVIAALLWITLPRARLASATMLSLGLVLTVNLIVGLSDARTLYDSSVISDLVQPYEKAGIAFAGQSYNAEFNFAGRMTHPVEILGADTLANWAEAHPDGVLIARPDRFDPGWTAARTKLFRNRPYAIWRMADRPFSEPNP